MPAERDLPGRGAAISPPVHSGPEDLLEDGERAGPRVRVPLQIRKLRPEPGRAGHGRLLPPGDRERLRVLAGQRRVVRGAGREEDPRHPGLLPRLGGRREHLGDRRRGLLSTRQGDPRDVPRRHDTVHAFPRGHLYRLLRSPRTGQPARQDLPGLRLRALRGLRLPWRHPARRSADHRAFIIHFSFLASFFWLNVMCFDIWWTFGGFRSLQGSAKQREKKKFIMYSIYAWGCATLLTAVCMVMDLVPGIPKHYIRPEFGVGSCWYYTNMARAIYFYGPMGVTVACNICLFVSTAIKIVRHKKDTAHHLKGSDSRRHDDNKQWFNLYLKLFIVMGISWSMEIISWLFEESSPKYIWYVSDIGNTLQGVIIFVIFVWKSKIKRLLLKRFGCQDRNFLSRESTRSAYNSSSRTCTTSAPLQEKANPYVDANFRQKTTSEDSDDV
ncbi:G-protein coupled receptor Mth2 isoform X6 [Orussus abietinus]|uniref:G-protein coupled receptor Mth2 isoform X6 n=2 Tax=Orussus abietinus TaxID=222816 RepID=UPI000C715D3F|nr:G-protein coupled receptor Mth2 isoform X6 [Orussus abietinus]